jgi:arylsulfatase A-like enzyme
MKRLRPHFSLRSQTLRQAIFENLQICIFAILIIGIPISTWAQTPSETKPNVVFIIVDDLNDFQGYLGGHPQAKTPNLDQLAQSSIYFSQAHSNVPVCSPSRNSLFTGTYAYDSGDFGWTPHYEQPSLKHNKTLFELFRENGYQIIGSGKLLHKNVAEYWDEWGVKLNNYGPFAFNGDKLVGHPSVPEPFQSIGPIDGSFASLADVPVFNNTTDTKQKPGWVYGWGKKPMRYVNDEDRDLTADELHAQWAIEKLQRMAKSDLEKPFFMGLGFVRPHTPMYAPQKYFDMFPLDSIKLPALMENDKEDTYYKDLFPPEMKGLRYYRTLKESYGGDAELAIKHFLQAYLACVAFVDAQIGKVVKAIEKSPFHENTIIIVTSDHGWQMGEKEYLFKNSPWEESTHIPFIMRVPNGPKGVEVDHPVSLIDIYPTLQDLCNLQGDNRKNAQGTAIGGHSLAPFIKDQQYKNWEGPDGALIMVGNSHNKDPFKQTYSYRTRDWRYIRYYDGQEELYDHANDPYEWNNLAGKREYKETLKRLRKAVLEIVGE